jgi:cytochrome P450
MSVTLHYDPMDPATLENPYPLYAKLRENTPVFWHEELNSWVLARYRDCRDVLRDIDLFARDRRRVGIEIPEFLQNVQTLDPPGLGPVKAFLMNALREQDLDEIGRRARRQIQGIFASLGEQAAFDWISEVAAPVALGITSELFGIDRPDLKVYVSLSDAIARRMDVGLLPERIEAGNQARNELNAMVAGWFERETQPGVLATVKRDIDEVEASQHYIRNSVGVMFNASYGTLFATVSNIALTLARHPEALEQLRDESLLATGVDELIRFDGPAQGTSRVATRRTTFGDAVVEPGQVVMTLLASANRDPEEFDRPDELVLDRSPNRHLAFGGGAHACLGSAFGRIAVRELVLCLLETPHRLRLAGTPVRRPTATVRSMDALPVTFLP